MIKTTLFIFSFLFLIVVNQVAYADFDKLDRSLIMRCSYFDFDNQYQHESITISQATIESAIDSQPAGIKVFKHGKAQTEVAFLIDSSGKFAECIYPSGHRVRVKVGEGMSFAHGDCGGNPEVWLSLWINKRKIESRLWFAGHCIEEHEPSLVSFDISNSPQGISLSKCHTATQQANNTSKNQPLSVCIDYPDVSKFSRDFIEYPRAGVELPKTNDVLLLRGTNPVCQLIQKQLRKDFFLFQQRRRRSPFTLITLLKIYNWIDTSIKLPEELYYAQESTFDFDNDGKLDRVFMHVFENHYMDGSVLLVQRGYSAKKLSVSDSIIDKDSSFFPCQFDTKQRNVTDCDPFPKGNEGSHLLMKGQGKNTVQFRNRYSSLEPFNFQGTNFVGINTISEDEKDYAGVIKPLTNRKFQPICLFKRVAENF